MVLKLVMPYIDRMITGGSVTKWYKAEGEWVRYGEELCEIEIQTIRVVRFTNPEPLAEQIKHLVEVRGPAAEAPLVEDIGLPPGLLVSLTSSDVGVVRRIYAVERAYRKVGDLLALLTTTEGEPIDDVEHALPRASAFRAVANIS